MNNNIKRILLLLLCLTPALLFFACSDNSKTDSSETPLMAAEGFMKSIKDQDTENFKAFLSDEIKTNFDEMMKVTGEIESEFYIEFIRLMYLDLQENYGDDWYNKLNYEETENNNGKAVIKVSIESENGTSKNNYVFIKEDNQWKLLQ